MLLYSILKTVFTSPGHIPEEREWDMVSDNYDSEVETQEANSRDFSAGQKNAPRKPLTNKTI